MFTACRSNRVLYNGSPATDVRNDLSELQKEQSDAAETSGRLTAESTDIEDRLADIGDTIVAGAGNDNEFESLIERIRNQKLPERDGED